MFLKQKQSVLRISLNIISYLTTKIARSLLPRVNLLEVVRLNDLFEKSEPINTDTKRNRSKRKEMVPQ